jgi:hypothetical protein
MATAVQILPPSPPHAGLMYDPYQFFKSASDNAKLLRGLADQSCYINADKFCYDSQGGGRIRLLQRRPVGRKGGVPLFSLNDIQLRATIAALVHTYSCYKFPKKEWCLTVSLDELKSLSNRQLKEYEQIARCHWGHRITENGRCEWKHKPLPGNHSFQHLRNLKRAGSYVHFLVRICYLSYRMGWDSVAVGQELGCTGNEINQRLFRLVLAARRLGFETRPVTDAKGLAALKKASQAGIYCNSDRLL